MPSTMRNDNLSGFLQLNNVTVITEEGSFSDSSSSNRRNSSHSSNGTRASANRSSGTTPSHHFSKLNKGRRTSFIPPSEDDPELELQDEIARSRTSGDCNLSALRLTAMPGSLPLATLTKLCLSDNTLPTLPEAAFTGKSCRALVSLDVNSNELTSLPASLFYLPALENLLLNHNRLTTLPDQVMTAELPAGKTFLPALKRVGLEFNGLLHFPMCFFRHCPHLSEVLLGQNEHMLENKVSHAALLASPAAANAAAGGPYGKLVLKLDNRPRLMAQVQRENWAVTLPWIDLSLHKIYPDKVLDYLFLGSMRTAQTVSVYHDLDIGYVLTVGRDLDVLIEPGMKHKVILIDDYPGADIASVFKEAFDFIDEARAAKKGILIHCFAGLSRSVTVAAAYIMKVKHMTRDDAMKLIKEARPAAQPNEGFMESLNANEGSLMRGEV